MVLLSAILPRVGAWLSGNADLFSEMLSKKEPLFSFGTRDVSNNDIFQELAMGFFATLPIAFLAGRLLLRLACLKLPLMRADLTNAIISTLAADGILELLIPSLKCVPTSGMFKSWVSLDWLQTMWGLDCFVRMNSDVFTPNGMLILSGIRVIFILIGLILGQGFNPIAITGGIATGKSSIVKLLQENEIEQSTSATEDKKEIKDEAKDKKGEGDDQEATRKIEELANFYLVDCDAIGHEILLSPEVLKADKKYSVLPGESVFHAICKAFAEDDILEKDRKTIDRVKLGTLVFGDAQKRKVLNKLTHPRIAWILWKRLFYGCFFSGKDLTVAEVPLLFESKSWMLRLMFCITLMVTVESAEVQMERLKKRNPSLSDKDCTARFKAQMPLEKKAKMANFVLHNGDDLDQVKQDLMVIQQAWLDHIYGMGISVTQIVGIVFITLVAGVSYQIYKQLQ
mmetsp:Transcript_8580/g.11332  ORF Transcript_8580/g.11332 Transcript_8580/m.11332 type:complete len:455 (-) Transcript_8580:115-1479(-)|eukprot:CAMPEP_0198143144 /NCGR_PEP_ID=MMETSP1443-20131203/5905_1 /TAXON_ID=186043 /ORGANISM="Entomoneis sp., Strain CCMP2396" /LENGTH=454 /DNA_ID=CAMNT_0043806313 /DNA_START=62 /DNA_END=1426 /DNA_ORIENTATION=-